MDYPGKVITKNQVTPTQTSAPGVWTLDDAAAATKNNNWPVAGVPNPISRSLRFNSADSAYLNRTFGTPTDGKKWTYSFWIKRVSFATNQPVIAAYTDANNQASLYYTTGNKLYWISTTGGTTYTQFRTDAVYRDASAWYHFVVVFDSTNATSTDRIKMYANGTALTYEAGQYIAPGLNTTAFVNTAIGHRIGNDQNLGVYNNGYLTEVNFIDGQALDATSFGMTDPQTGVWIPKKYTGTYGTNGFYLNFKDNTSTTTLGYDYSGNGNNWTANNFSVTVGAGNDSMVDVPTPWVAYNTTGDIGGVVRGNYATLNPLSRGGFASMTNGNLEATISTSGTWANGTIAVSSGKYYFECVLGGATAELAIGISPNGANAVASLNVHYYSADGKVYINNVASATGATFTAGDVIGVAFEPGGEAKFYKNNTLQATVTMPSGSDWCPEAYQTANRSNTATFNFGQRPFAYTPPAGFLSLCTTNLPTPTIGASSTTTANKYFDVTLWTGDNATTRAITGVGFQPDLVWIKQRSSTASNVLTDAIRGAGYSLLSNQTAAEDLNNEFGYLSAFNSNGFTVSKGVTNWGRVNASAETYVGWSWNAGGSTVTNTAGTISSQVRANTTAGFSIVTYTGGGTAPQSIGHGLGVSPSMIILKRRDTTSDWYVNHVSIGTNDLRLNTTDVSAANGIFSAKSSTTFTINSIIVQSGTWVAYCFAAVPGFSAFGSYTGNGSATDGPFVYCGFRPKYVLYKRTDVAQGWGINDGVRNPYNYANLRLLANAADAEEARAATDVIDLLSNGFKIRSDTTILNASGGTYIFAAFAESPFKYANAR